MHTNAKSNWDGIKAVNNMQLRTVFGATKGVSYGFAYRANKTRALNQGAR